MNGPRHIGWTHVHPGDRVRLRYKRRAGVPRVEVTVVEVLPRVLGDGSGFVADDGETYRQFHWDIDLVDD